MLVIDTSVAFKWFDKSEENYDIAKEILNDHLNGKQEIAVPELFLYEISNAWATKSALQLNKIRINLELIKEFSLTIFPANFEFLGKVIEFAKEHTVSVYDATYAVLAQERKCKLVTADSQFTKVVKQDYVANLADLGKIR